MKIKDLKKIIEDIDDNIDIGDTGHMGEFLECFGISVDKIDNNKIILRIQIEDAGQEPY